MRGHLWVDHGLASLIVEEMKLVENLPRSRKSTWHCLLLRRQLQLLSGMQRVLLGTDRDCQSLSRPYKACLCF